MNKEIWKDIPSFDGYYQVSNRGRIRSWKGGNNFTGVQRLKEPKILTLYKEKNGYLRANICHNNKKQHLSVHRCVAECFVKNPEDKPQVNHKNGIKSDNIFSNIEWATPSENHVHAHENGFKNADHVTGEKNHNSKLTKTDVVKIDNLLNKGSFTQKEIGNRFNVSASQISHIKCGKLWSHITGR